MGQFVALIRQRYSENATWIDYFVVENSDNPEQNFRDAIKEYLLTEDGIQDIKNTSEDFNWGDAIVLVPDEMWEKHNIKPVYKGDSVVIGKQIVIVVNQDEILIPSEYYEMEQE